jgi:hypothetical protein
LFPVYYLVTGCSLFKDKSPRGSYIASFKLLLLLFDAILVLI